MSLLSRALLACVVLTFAAAAHAATVSGTVFDSVTRNPLGGMVVAAYDTTGTLRATGTTDATGLYVLTLPNGHYRVLAYDPAGIYATTFDAHAESFETSPVRIIGAAGANLDFALVRGGTIAGRVESGSGIPRAGAIVEVYNLSGTRRAFTTVNSNGDFSVVLPPGDYKLVAYDPNGVYALSFHPNARSFAEAVPVRVTEGVITPGIFFTLGVAAHVSGIAVDAQTQAPLPAISVYAYTSDGALVASMTTDASGAFRFSLPAGAYRFVAADAARTYATAFYDGSLSFERSQIVTLAAGEQRPNVRLALARGVLITGRVNAPNLVVAAYNLDGTLHSATTSDSSANYTLVVVPGEYKVAAFDPSLTYATRFYADTADFRSATRVLAQSNISGIDVTLPRGGRIAGTLRDATSMQPLAGTTVAAYDTNGVLVATAVTNANGQYALVVAPGPYRVVAFDTRLDYATAYAGGASSYDATLPITINADTTTTVDIAMRRGLRVTGQVTTKSGTALTGIEVFALDASGNRIAGTVSNEGAFTIVLLPGTYRFVAVDPAHRYSTAEYPNPVTVSNGQVPPPVLITLQGSGRHRAVRS